MKKLAVLMGLALLLLWNGCGNSAPTNNITTSTSGYWEATLFGGTGQTSLMDFVVQFSVTDTTGQPNRPLSITGFSFFNAGQCFTPGENQQTVSGTATLTTASTGDVTGTLNLSITALNSGTQLAFTNTSLTGTSNGTTTTTGTLSGGVVVGNWTLTPGTGVTGCSTPANPTFIMCQGAATCTAP